MSVYFVLDAASNAVKIGHSAEPWLRLVKMQADTPGKLRMLTFIKGGIEVEQQLHQRFQHLRQRGEWFSFTGDLVAYVGEQPPVDKAVASLPGHAFWGGRSDSEIARILGMHQTGVMRMRAGKTKLSPSNALRIQRVTGLSAIQLVFGELTEEALAHVPHLGARAA